MSDKIISKKNKINNKSNIIDIFIDSQNCYNYSLYNNTKYNIINNNIIKDQNIPSKKFVRLLNYSNSDNFLSTAFGISIKKVY